VIQFHLITLFPEMFEALNYGIVGRAQKSDILKLHFLNPRNYTQDKNGRVDDRPYGGGPGMVMKVQPLRDTILAAKNQSKKQTKVIYLSPQGKLLNQKAIEKFSHEEELILLMGRYEGIDERVIENDIDEEWSIGDYVLSGGELAAMIMIDAITRLLPGALGDETSSLQESFSENLLDFPHYTRPEEIDHQKVPEVLLNGHHAEITRWRLQQSLGKTWGKRPDLLKDHSLNPEEIILLQEFIEKMRK
jgi:tRNA (guanine37-N1)-methyltransferase